MSDQSVGVLMFHFTLAILLTAVASRIIIAWYRRSVTRSMGLAGGTPTEADPWLEREFAASWQRVPTGTGARAASSTASGEARLRWRLAVIYGVGGLAAAAVMATCLLYAFGESLRPLRTFAVFYAFCWPVVPTLSFLLGLSRGRALLAFAAYAAAGFLMTASLSAVMRWGFGWMDAEPLSNAANFLRLLAIQAWLPFLIILATSSRRTRSVTPIVLAGMLVFIFSNIAVGELLVHALDIPELRKALLSLGAHAAYNLWYLLAAVPIGFACWQGLRWLGGHYDRKAFSDAQLLVDAWWLIIVFIFSLFLVNDFGWAGLLGLAAFLAYRAIVAAGLALLPLGEAQFENHRLLLLRVFGFQRRTERLFDTVAQRWRWLGSLRMIAGDDLATRIIGPGDLISFLGGRFRQLFLQRDRASFQRLGELDEMRDPDGRYRVNKVYCHRDSWQPALQRLLATTDLVLMDLRGFSERKRGCLFELQQLVEQDLLQRTVFVVDATTDTKLLESVLAAEAQKGADGRAQPGLNLVQAQSGSAADSDKVYGALRALVPT